MTDYFQVWKQQLTWQLATSEFVDPERRKQLLQSLGVETAREERADSDFSIIRPLRQLSYGFVSGLTGVHLGRDEARNFVDVVARGVGQVLGFLGVVPGPGFLGRIFTRGVLRNIKFFKSPVFRTLQRAAETDAPAIIRLRSLPLYVADRVTDAARGLTAETAVSRFLQSRLGQAAEEGLRLATAQGVLEVQDALSAIAQGKPGEAITRMLGSSLLGALEGAGMRLISTYVFPRQVPRDVIGRAVSSALYSGGVSKLLGNPWEAALFDTLLGLGFGFLEPVYEKQRALEILSTAMRRRRPIQKLYDEDLPEWREYVEKTNDPEDVRQRVREELMSQLEMSFGHPLLLSKYATLLEQEARWRDLVREELERDNKLSREDAELKALLRLVSEFQQEEVQLAAEAAEKTRPLERLETPGGGLEAFRTQQELLQFREAVLDMDMPEGVRSATLRVSAWARNILGESAPQDTELESKLLEAILRVESPDELGGAVSEVIGQYMKRVPEVGVLRVAPPDDVERDLRRVWHTYKRTRALPYRAVTTKGVIQVPTTLEGAGDVPFELEVLQRANPGGRYYIISRVIDEDGQADVALEHDFSRFTYFRDVDGTMLVPYFGVKAKGKFVVGEPFSTYYVYDPERLPIEGPFVEREIFMGELIRADADYDSVRRGERPPGLWDAAVSKVQSAVRYLSDKGLEEEARRLERDFYRLVADELGLDKQIVIDEQGRQLEQDYAFLVNSYVSEIHRNISNTSLRESEYIRVEKQYRHLTGWLASWLSNIRFLEEASGGIRWEEQIYYNLTGQGDFLLSGPAINKRAQLLDDANIRVFYSGEDLPEGYYTRLVERIRILSGYEPVTTSSDGREVFVRVAMLRDLMEGEAPGQPMTSTFWRRRKNRIEAYAARQGVDGAWIVHPALFDEIARYAGIDARGAIKASTIYTSQEEGLLLGKYALFRASAEEAETMQRWGVGIIAYESGIKARGLRKLSRHRINTKGRWEILDRDGIIELPLSSFRFNYSSSEHFHSQTSPQRLPRQFITEVGDSQLSQAIYERFIEPEARGDVKETERVLKAIRTGGDIQGVRWDDVSIDAIWELVNSKNTTLKARFYRWLLARREELLSSEDVVDAREVSNLISQADIPGANLLGVALEEGQVPDLLGLSPVVGDSLINLAHRYIVRRVTRPRVLIREGGKVYNPSALTIFRPQSHAARSQFDGRRKGFRGKRLEEGWVVISRDVAERMDVKVGDRWMKLVDAWNEKRELEAALKEGGKGKAKLRRRLRELDEALRFHLMRVPIGSRSGVRNVRIADVRDDLMGTQIMVAAEDMVHLGGADLDIDKGYLIQSMDVLAPVAPTARRTTFWEWFEQYKDELFERVRLPSGEEVPIFAEEKELVSDLIEEMPDYKRSPVSVGAPGVLLSISRNAYLGNRTISASAVSSRRVLTALSALSGEVMDVRYTARRTSGRGTKARPVQIEPDIRAFARALGLNEEMLEGRSVRIVISPDAITRYSELRRGMLNLAADAGDYAGLKMTFFSVNNELSLTPLLGAEVRVDGDEALSRRLTKELHRLVGDEETLRRRVLQEDKQLRQLIRAMPWSHLSQADKIIRARDWRGRPITAEDILQVRARMDQTGVFWQQVRDVSAWYRSLDLLMNTFTKPSGPAQSLRSLYRTWLRERRRRSRGAARKRYEDLLKQLNEGGEVEYLTEFLDELGASTPEEASRRLLAPEATEALEKLLGLPEHLQALRSDPEVQRFMRAIAREGMPGVSWKRARELPRQEPTLRTERWQWKQDFADLVSLVMLRNAYLKVREQVPEERLRKIAFDVSRLKERWSLVFGEKARVWAEEGDELPIDILVFDDEHLRQLITTKGITLRDDELRIDEPVVVIDASARSPALSRLSALAQAGLKRWGDDFQVILTAGTITNLRRAAELLVRRGVKVSVAVTPDVVERYGGTIEGLRSVFRELPGDISTSYTDMITAVRQEVVQYLQRLQTPEERLWAEAYLLSTLKAQPSFTEYKKGFEEWYKRARQIYPEVSSMKREEAYQFYLNKWHETYQHTLGFSMMTGGREAMRLYVDAVREISEAARDLDRRADLLIKMFGPSIARELRQKGILDRIAFDPELMQRVTQERSTTLRAIEAISDYDRRRAREVLEEVERLVQQGRSVEEAFRMEQRVLELQMTPKERQAMAELRELIESYPTLGPLLRSVFRGWARQEKGTAIDISNATVEMIRTFVRSLRPRKGQKPGPWHTLLFPDVMADTMRRAGNIELLGRGSDYVLTDEGIRRVNVIEPVSRMGLLHNLMSLADTEQARQVAFLEEQMRERLSLLDQIIDEDGRSAPVNDMFEVAVALRELGYLFSRTDRPSSVVERLNWRFIWEKEGVGERYEKLRNRRFRLRREDRVEEYTGEELMGSVRFDEEGNPVEVRQGLISEQVLTPIFKRIYEEQIDLPPRLRRRFVVRLTDDVFVLDMPQLLLEAQGNDELIYDLVRQPLRFVFKLAEDYALWFNTPIYKVKGRWTTRRPEGMVEARYLYQLPRIEARKALDDLVSQGVISMEEVGRVPYEFYWPRMIDLTDREIMKLMERIERMKERGTIDEVTYAVWREALMQRTTEEERQAEALEGILGGERMMDYNRIKMKWQPSFVMQRRQLTLPFYRRDARVLSQYVSRLVRARVATVKAVLGDFLVRRKLEIPEDTTGEIARAWRDFLWLYLRGTLGLPSVFPADKEYMNRWPYRPFTDEYMIEKMRKIDRLLGTSLTYRVVYKDRRLAWEPIPEGERHRIALRLARLSQLEGKYQLATLLFSTRSMVNNFFGGALSTAVEAGMRYMLRALRLENIRRLDPRRFRNWHDVARWAAEHGAFESFLLEEASLSPGFGTPEARRFLRDVIALIRRDPLVPDDTIIQLARRYGLGERFIETSAVFMRYAERKLRLHAFLAHYLRARDVLMTNGLVPDVDDPYLIRMAVRGVENSQFLYSNADRPVFAQSPMGRIFMRFRLWVANSVRQRLRFWRESMLDGWSNEPVPRLLGGEGAERLERAVVSDLLVFALAWALPFSFIESAMPALWGYVKDYAEAIFGDEEERRRAFFGLLPWPLNMVQPALPPAARLVELPLAMALLPDIDYYLNYHVWTLFPGGLILRTAYRTIANPEFAAETVFGLPLHSLDRFLETGGRAA